MTNIYAKTGFWLQEIIRYEMKNEDRGMCVYVGGAVIPSLPFQELILLSVSILQEKQI